MQYSRCPRSDPLAWRDTSGRIVLHMVTQGSIRLLSNQASGQQARYLLNQFFCTLPFSSRRATITGKSNCTTLLEYRRRRRLSSERYRTMESREIARNVLYSFLALFILWFVWDSTRIAFTPLGPDTRHFDVVVRRYNASTCSPDGLTSGKPKVLSVQKGTLRVPCGHVLAD